MLSGTYHVMLLYVTIETMSNWCYSKTTINNACMLW